MKQPNRKRTVIILIICILSALLVSVLPVSGEELYGKLVRLHVLANSDSEADQALKLGVRDRVIETLTPLLSDCADKEEALAVITANWDAVESAARDYLLSCGCEDSVRIEIGQEYYPTRQYESLRLPAGTYDSVRILIGEGAGKNWWCVLFPPLCLDAAKGEAEEQLLAAGLTPGEIRILTDADNPKYVLKFRILEWLGSLFH